MILWGLLVGFFREMFGLPRTQKELSRRREENRARVMARLDDYAFYRRLPIRRWEDIPVIAKKDYLAFFHDLNRPKLRLEQALDFGLRAETEGDDRRKWRGHTIGLSTGTSGRRWAFVVRDFEIGQWGGTILAKTLGWGIFRPQRIAFVFRTNSPLYNGVNRGWLKLRFFSLHDDVEKTARALREFHPTVLISVPHFLSAYLAVRPVREISPRLVISGADVLEEREKKRLHDYFGFPVTEIYQATEGFLALGCRAGHLHFNEADTLIEKEDLGGGRFHPIVTDVRRETQAIIRYRMDDICEELDHPCPCGAPTLALRKVEGRADQVLRFQSPNGEVAVFPDLLRDRLGRGDYFDWNYLVEQTGPAQLRVTLDRALSANDQSRLRADLAQAFQLRGLEMIETDIRHAQEFPVMNGKRRRIVGPTL